MEEVIGSPESIRDDILHKDISMKNFIVFILLLAVHLSSSAQVFEKFKLKESEIPKEYKITDKTLFKSIQPKLFYDNPDLYKSILGSVKSKEYQSFESANDEGTVVFFEYEKNVDSTGFLEGLLWGGSKPTREHPEEYLIKDNILIIWSFSKKSPIKKLLMEKVKLAN
ncbi:MAG TPA: hypothetical protein DGG95_18490 [Cytophagales bacterium]|jgi:hypothetical protein|nr:hypothetical protein [Cytophagales bacterium]